MLNFIISKKIDNNHKVQYNDRISEMSNVHLGIYHKGNNPNTVFDQFSDVLGLAVFEKDNGKVGKIDSSPQDYHGTQSVMDTYNDIESTAAFFQKSAIEDKI